MNALRKHLEQRARQLSKKPHPMQSVIDEHAGYRIPCVMVERESYRRLSDVPTKTNDGSIV